MATSNDYAYNIGFTDKDSEMLAGHYAQLANEPRQCFHPCFWVIPGHGICNELVQGYGFSEHLRTRHVPWGTEKTQVMCCWSGCSAEMKKESLMRHVQEKHLEWRYGCSACREQFTRTYTRDQHVTKKHSGN